MLITSLVIINLFFETCQIYFFSSYLFVIDFFFFLQIHLFFSLCSLDDAFSPGLFKLH